MSVFKYFMSVLYNLLSKVPLLFRACDMDNFITKH